MSSGSDATTLHPGWEARFDELAELAGPARAARLAEIAQGDPEMARFLGELLAADEGEILTLGEPLGGRAPQFVVAALDRLPRSKTSHDRSGELVGRYRLLRLLGRGGMAEVYLAERADGEFEQQVALKLILPGLGTETILERFLRERQILAQLEHPGIARLLDGGKSPDGDPYFVMEHVDGQTITDACEQEQASIERRIRLLIEVCEAVELAHQKLVVHRDLKPSNILVTTDGRAKLLDFGIAKLLADEPQHGHTRIEAAAFTPAYAAPEQILGQPVTTATDVFALGILLFELLTGRQPFDRSARPLTALLAAVSAERLERPSAALRGAPGRDRDRRSRQLEGNLDTIVGRALTADPARRYPTAAALADDLRRYLERRPILARADSFGYRASRFVARHRWGVAAGALALASLLAGLAVALWQASVAQQQARRAERTRDFLVALFKEADPSHSLGATITAREILDAGARRVTRELAGEPALEAEMLDAIAQVERSLGLTAEARGHAFTALGLRRDELGSTSPEVAASRLTHAEVLIDLGELAAARRELEVAAPHLAGGEEATRRYAEARANALWQSGDTTAAMTEVESQLAAAAAAHGSDSLEAARWQFMLAALLVDSSRIAEGAAMGRAAAAIFEAAPAASGLELAGMRAQLAEMLELAGDRDAPLEQLAGALALQREILGPHHPQVAFTEIQYGFALNDHRRYDDAERVLLDAITILAPIGHYDQASALRYLGFTYMGRNRFADAEQAFARALAIYREKVGADSPLTLGARLSHGWALLRLGRLPEAEVELRAVVADLAPTASSGDYALRSALKYLGEVRRERGDAREALALHRRARAIEVEIFATTEHPGVAVSDLQIALDLLALPSVANLAEARALVDEGLATLRAKNVLDVRYGQLLVASGRVARAQGDTAGAVADLADGIARLSESIGADDPETKAAAALLAQSKARSVAPP